MKREQFDEAKKLLPELEKWKKLQETLNHYVNSKQPIELNVTMQSVNPESPIGFTVQKGKILSYRSNLVPTIEEDRISMLLDKFEKNLRTITDGIVEELTRKFDQL